MNITKEEFDSLYPDLANGNTWHLLTSKPASDRDFIDRYLPSKLWRLNNLYTIIDVDGNRIGFRMNLAQHKVYSALRKHARLIILKSRQQGISTFWLICFFDDALFMSDLNIGMMAQGNDEAENLLEKVKLCWTTFPPSILSEYGIEVETDNSKAFALNNNSKIFIRVSFRSATLQRLHISEFGKIANNTPKRAKETKTGSLQSIHAGNPVVIESTAEGDNMFKKEWDKAVGHGGKYAPKDFMPIFLSWIYDPKCVLDMVQEIVPAHQEYFEVLEAETGEKLSSEQKYFWVQQERELGDDVYQEYPGTPEEAFRKNLDGAYYAKLYSQYIVKGKRLIKDLYDSNLDVEVVFDLGMDDYMVLGFFQTYRNEIRLIDEYISNGKALEHYYNVMKDKPYRITKVTLPHDGSVRGLDSGVTRKRTLQLLGARNVKILPRSSVDLGIENTRQLIKFLYIDTRCKYIIRCLREYTKDWDEVLETWKDYPKKKMYVNHGADMLRYKAMSMRNKLKKASREEYNDNKISSDVVDGLCL